MSCNPTNDGFSFTPDGGISTGLSSSSVITPSQCFTSTETLYDAIVVGAGWTGVTTVRDLTSRGFKVLLLEARDRIGGRTWTSVIDGHPFELGGTYVHWGQSHVWTEITRYNLQDYVTDVFDNSDDTTSGLNDSDLAEALTKFFNVDGYNGAKVIPFPHNPAIGDATHLKYDSMSLDDRLQEIRGDLDPSIITPLVVMLLCNGGDLETKSFFEFLQRWALCGYNAKGYVDYHIRYKLKIGQSDFLKHLWKHALQTGNLSYRFSSPVNSVDTTNANDTTITTTDGTIYHARKVIVTVPLAVLKQISFLPTLPHLKAEAYAQATGNIAAKVIAVATGTDWVGRSVFADNDGFTFTMTGESVAAWGNDTVLVAFHSASPKPTNFELIKHPRECLIVNPDGSQHVMQLQWPPFQNLPADLVLSIVDAIFNEYAEDIDLGYDEDEFYCEEWEIDEFVRFQVWKDVANLARACKGFYALITPVLYLRDLQWNHASALLLSAKNGSVAGVLKSLECGADVDQQDHTTLYEYSEEVDQDYNDDTGYWTRWYESGRMGVDIFVTALHWAAIYRHPQVVETLLHRGADVNLEMDFGNRQSDEPPYEHFDRSLFICRSLSEHVATPGTVFRGSIPRGQDMLLEYELGSLLSKGGNALYCALLNSKRYPFPNEDYSRSCLPNAKLLVDAGSSLITYSTIGLHALHQACGNWSFEAADFLLTLDRVGIDPNQPSRGYCCITAPTLTP
ncbi:hypothetical protein CkaCkLH20_03689 [Colletotrichum karsti]|uniref:Amine oxidase domain-containing protein n=1 Tax=Colletotrichum karsti TaxID=1095194 RepID=A0A9P6LJW7_9PEZI|nr:uncharacterized protein CkaCkLH20_03689 [Colletotrichum karsti]KAF9878789.1 hypothetical protein CkaCkLH20_03689 [Colletotrichum karsti]